MVVDSPDTGDAFRPPRPAPRWGLRGAVAALTAAALVWGGLEAYDYAFVRCADGVREQGPADECVGVTDGSYVFHSSLKDVLGRIREENRRVDESGQPWVAIAYVEPMTVAAGDKGWASIEQELRGAHLAQLRLNSGQDKGSLPQIKLLPANPGSGSRQWRSLVSQLAGMTGGEGRVVAVGGFGQSLLTTEKAVDALRAEGVPMVGSTVTADGLSDRGDLGFFRVVAPNADQAAAVARHLGERQRAKGGKYRVQLVKDRNADDIYSASLREGFVRAAERNGLRLEAVQVPFVSRSKAAANGMMQVANEICAEGRQPDAVYFAGRGRDLKGFIEAAGANGRRCPVTVFTGDDAVGMFFDIPTAGKEEYRRFLERWRNSGVGVRYTALAHPEAAGDVYGSGGRNPYDAFLDAYRQHYGGNGSQRDLRNGQTLLGHDAVFVLGEAIRDAAGTGADSPVDTDTVRDMLVQITGSDNRVEGASGPIAFDDAGNPAGKPLPLVELRPKRNDEYEYLDVLRP